MREFVFTLRYDPGVDPLMDVFIETLELFGQSLACSVTADSMWRLDRYGGPDAALKTLATHLFETDRCEECVGSHNCHSPCEHELLAETSSTVTVYTYRPETGGCHSIPNVAARHLGDGLFFETVRRGAQYRWRVLLRDEQSVGGLYDALEADLREGVALDLEHVGTPTRWGDGFATAADLPAPQREALETAVERGYYETPRATTAAEIAADLNVPQSTFQYRLQRAEAWLATQFVTALPSAPHD
jgi:predicted DNA binding protein